MIDGGGISCKFAPNMNVTGLHWWSVNIAWRHQAITWAIVDQDLRHHMSSLGHNELIKNVVWKHAARFGSTTYSRHDLSYYPGGEPTEIVANVITFEMFAPTNAYDISITFGAIEICVRDSDWLKSLIAASP